MLELNLGPRESLERIRVFTPLGIRFWDPVLDAPVSDNLTVTARSAGQIRQRPTYAYRTASGVYAFQGLPGLHAVEYPADEAAPAGSPPVTHRFLVQVVDRKGRFLPVLFHVDLPHRGIFPTDALNGPLGARPPGFYLFSAPTRPATSTLAVVRAQLAERIDAVTERPAVYAVLEVRTADDQLWYGLADERGSVAVLFPYPTFSAASSALLSSPPVAGPPRWEISIRVRYAPAARSIPPGYRLPELRSLFSQPAGVIWPLTPPGQSISELSAELIFGQELVMRTDGGSALLIGPALSSP